MENEEASFTLNLSLGLLFAIVCCFAASRIISLYENTTGGKVVTTFYFLIFVSALLRSILFFIPSFTTSLSVHTAQNFVYLSIIFLGNVFVYSVFHLVVAYWQNILRKIDTEEEEFRRHLFLRFTELDRKGPMSHFLDSSISPIS
jgi:predicted metal-binding membrane protein